MGDFVFGRRGKRLRPVVTLLSAALFGPPSARAVDVAAAVELVHNATLIHDDVIDGAELRRGLPSANNIFGIGPSVLFGDFLFCRAFNQVSRHNDRFIGEAMIEAASGMCQGEIFQNSRNFDPDISREECMSVLTNKTAQFMARCAALGAYCGGASGAEIKKLESYGLDIGKAFQIADDVFDLAADPDSIGKPSGIDVREGKITLPLLILLGVVGRKKSSSIKKTIRSRKIRPGFVDELRTLARSTGALDAAIAEARSFSERAKKTIARVGKNSRARESLFALADFVVERSS